MIFKWVVSCSFGGMQNGTIKQPDYVLGQFVDKGRIITYEHDTPHAWGGGSGVYAEFKVYLKPVKYWRRSFFEKMFPNLFESIVKKWMLSRRIVSQIHKQPA